MHPHRPIPDIDERADITGIQPIDTDGFDDRFSDLLQESHGYRWRMTTPVRVYTGGIDEVTPVYLGHCRLATSR